MSQAAVWHNDPVYDWLLEWAVPGIEIHIDKGADKYSHNGHWKITTEYDVRLIRQGQEKTVADAMEAMEWATVTKGARSIAPHRPPVWYAIPSANPSKAQHCLDQWSAMGYRTAVLLDAGADPVVADIVLYCDKWFGYPAAVKQLCDAIGDQADIVVTGGDDIYPDPKTPPGIIHAQFIEHFGGTLGVMQPTGDRWMENDKGVAGVERVCMSPWMGREFIKRNNGGRGPFWLGYFHFFCDEEMHEVVNGAGLLWQRRDLTQLHDHWSRADTGGGAEKNRPDYLDQAQEGWGTAKKLFDARKKAKFPGADIRERPPKIVALTIAHNEEWSLGFTGRATLMWADKVVFLNHNSDDRTKAIMAAIRKEYPDRVSIINVTEKRWSEMAHRQRTLELARGSGATHCCVVDADEVLSGNLLPMIRNWILRLVPGQVLQLPWVCLWRGLKQYRNDSSIWSHSFITMAFGDRSDLAWKPREDGYEFHQRGPIGVATDIRSLRPVGQWAGGGLLHMQHAQWNRLLAKQAWYKMKERVMYPGRDKAIVVDKRYHAAVDEHNLRTEPVPKSWLAPYKDILKHLRLDMVPWQIADMKAMMAKHGPQRFDGLNLYGILDA